MVLYQLFVFCIFKIARRKKRSNKGVMGIKQKNLAQKIGDEQTVNKLFRIISGLL